MADDPSTLIEQSSEARRRGDPAAAMRLAAEAVDLARARDNRVFLGEALAAMARLRRDEQQYDAAVRLYEESAAVARQCGDKRPLAHRLRHIGDIAAEQGDLQVAESSYAEAERLFEGMDVGELDKANFLRSKALLSERQGESETAFQLWQEAQKLYRASRIDEGVKECGTHMDMLRAS